MADYSINKLLEKMKALKEERESELKELREIRSYNLAQTAYINGRLDEINRILVMVYETCDIN